MHASLLPFDSDDGPPDYNKVHTELPPEQIIPPHFTDPSWLRADFSGTTLEGSYFPTTSEDIIANGGVTITSGRWKGLWIPFLVGANTTPPTMLMTPMLIMYPRDVQDAFLTEQAERALDDFVIDPESWNGPSNGWTMLAGGRGVPSDVRDWCRYVKSWGFRVAVWRGDFRRGVDTMLQTLFDADVVSFYCHGEEVDNDGNHPGVTSSEYEASLQQMDRYISGRVPIGVHFTCVGAAHHYGMGYPIGAPRDDYMRDWSPYNGRVHLCLQLGADISAGLQGSATYYARKHLMGIGDAALGPGAPNSRVIAWETSATDKLYGRKTETDGARRTWEQLCGTRDDPRIPPVWGFTDGGRQHDGRWL